MSDRPIDAEIRTGAPAEPDETPGVAGDLFREAMSLWASGVAVLSVRDPDDGHVYAATVSSFASVSARPPRIVVSLGPGAQPLPFLAEGEDGPGGAEDSTGGEEPTGTPPDHPPPGTEFVVNVLSEDQRGLARRYTDPYPVGPSPFPSDGTPSIEDAHAVVVCRVERIVPVGSSRLVVGLVVDARVDERTGPLLHYRRAYHAIGPEPPST